MWPISLRARAIRELTTTMILMMMSTIWLNRLMHSIQLKAISAPSLSLSNRSQISKDKSTQQVFPFLFGMTVNALLHWLLLCAAWKACGPRAPTGTDTAHASSSSLITWRNYLNFDLYFWQKLICCKARWCTCIFWCLWRWLQLCWGLQRARQNAPARTTPSASLSPPNHTRRSWHL